MSEENVTEKIQPKSAFDLTEEEYAIARSELVLGPRRWSNRDRPKTAPASEEVTASQKVTPPANDKEHPNDYEPHIKALSPANFPNSEAFLDAFRKADLRPLAMQSKSSPAKTPPAEETKPKNAMDMTEEEWQAARRRLPR